MSDLSVVVVSVPDEPRWLEPCLRSLQEATGPARVDVVVVDNGRSASAARLVGERFPHVRAVRCENRGFGHANNRGLEVAQGRHVLFLNPDTEVRAGTLADLVDAMDADARLGAAGLRQVLPDGSVYPTARRFPAVHRLLVPERVPLLGPRLGERLLGAERYARAFRCDWAAGSALLVRRSVLDAIGPFDERFFLYSEETDLCRRIRDGGYEIALLPQVTVVHHVHAGRALAPRMEAQMAWARVQYARKHFGPVRRRAYEHVLRLRYAARARLRPAGREAARAALETIAGRREPPFAALQR